MTDIQHVVPSSSTRRVILGAFERDVEVWDVPSRRLIGALSTTFDFGGSRLALSDQCEVLLAGAYERYGLAAYRLASGERLWQRSDLKKVQRLALSVDGSRVFCGREGAPCEVIDTVTGETVERVRGSGIVRASRWDPVRFNDQRRPALQTSSGQRRFVAPRLTFAFLDIEFAPGRLFLSESAGALRCLSTESGRELWRYEPGANAHVLHMAYRVDDDTVVAVERTFTTHDPYRVVLLSGAEGLRLTQYEVEGTSHGFCDYGQCLVTSTRKVLASESGRVLGVLDERSLANQAPQPTSGGQAGVE